MVKQSVMDFGGIDSSDEDNPKHGTIQANPCLVMNSVEGVRQYMEVEQEAPEHFEETKPGETWPEKGAVRFKDLTIQYTEGAPVLKNVDASIKPREDWYRWSNCAG
jgi:ABC-type multidrug transport system fused ATPase/permease subunit